MQYPLGCAARHQNQRIEQLTLRLGRQLSVHKHLKRDAALRSSAGNTRGTCRTDPMAERQVLETRLLNTREWDTGLFFVLISL